TGPAVPRCRSIWARSPTSTTVRSGAAASARTAPATLGPGPWSPPIASSASRMGSLPLLLCFHVHHLAALVRPADGAQPVRQDRPADDCFLCRGVAGTDDRANLLVYRSGLSVVVLNRFPYNNGHLLVAPKEHKGRPDELTPEQLLDLQLVLRKMMGVIERRMT